MHLVFLLLFFVVPQLYVRTDFTSVLYSFILVFLLTLSPLIQMFCSFASAAVERRFLLLMSSSSPIGVPTFLLRSCILCLFLTVLFVLSCLHCLVSYISLMLFYTSAISVNSNPIKSTSSAYTISVVRVFSKSEVGRSKMVLTSFRAFSKYMENKTELRLSPCGDPMLLSNGFPFVAPLILFLCL